MADHQHSWVSLEPIGRRIEIVLEGRGRSVFVITDICEDEHCFMGKTGDGLIFDIRQGVQNVEGMHRMTSGLLHNGKESE